MEITFNIQILLDASITPNQYLVLHLVDNYSADVVSRYLVNVGPFKKADLDVLKEKEFVTFPDSGQFGLKDIEITEKFRKLASVKMEDHIDERDGELQFYRQVYDVFPEKIKSGGYKVKSGFPEFCRRLAVFKKKNPIFTNRIILKSTERYVAKMKMQGYKFMRLAKFFVFKGVVSDSQLYDECQEYLELLSKSEDNDKTVKHGEDLR